MQIQILATKLRSNLSQFSTTLDTDNNAEICAAIGAADFAMVTISSGSVTEEIKIGACSEGMPFIIARGVNNTEARFFPSGACVSASTSMATSACPAVVNQSWVLPNAKTSAPYSNSFNTGFANAELADYSAPDGFEIDLVGGVLTLNVICPIAQTGSIVAELVDGDCIVAVVSGSLTVIFECPPDTSCK